jgi:hypothetical protein
MERRIQMKARMSKQFQVLRKDPAAERQLARIFMGYMRPSDEESSKKKIVTSKGTVVIRSKEIATKKPA